MGRVTWTAPRLADQWRPPGAHTMQLLGSGVAEAIRRRTRSGQDENGRAFAPYAPSTRKRKGTATVTLDDGGGMLNDLGPTSTNDRSVRVGFSDAHLAEIAGYHMTGTRRMPQRRFLGADPAWIESFLDAYYRPFQP